MYKKFLRLFWQRAIIWSEFGVLRFSRVLFYIPNSAFRILH